MHDRLVSVQRKATGIWRVSVEVEPRIPRRRNTPRLPRGQRREQLLDAALRVVARADLDRLTMQAVAQEAEVAKPVLYARTVESRDPATRRAERR